MPNTIHAFERSAQSNPNPATPLFSTNLARCLARFVNSFFEDERSRQIKSNRSNLNVCAYLNVCVFYYSKNALPL
uniref:MIP08390p n=1 Tax=Drosophila melanogaster TaxID=7227 RepID=C0PV44_DROME|nr:MIP08390p [Drosophila melanogaster]